MIWYAPPPIKFVTELHQLWFKNIGTKTAPVRIRARVKIGDTIERFKKIQTTSKLQS